MIQRTSLLLLTLVALAACSVNITNEEAKAAFTLAYNYQHGISVQADIGKAAMYYKQAAEGGLAEAQFNLGNLYVSGSGVTLNHQTAVEWFRKAAEQGMPQAQFNLANAYRTGDGVEQNYARAAQWYRNASDRGFAAAQFNLGAMYGNGEGIPQDYAEAYYWLLLSSKQGYAEATKYLKNFSPDLSPAARRQIETEVDQAHAAIVAGLEALAKTQSSSVSAASSSAGN
jgi:TPR repeat protein